MRRIGIIAFALLRDLVRKKDLYVLAVLAVIFFGYAARAVFFNDAPLTRYFREAAQTVLLLFSLCVCVPFTAKLMIEEMREATIYPLLAKPVTRAEVVVGKYFGAVLVAAATFSVLFGIFVVTAYAMPDRVPALLYVQAYVLGVLMLVMLCALVMLLSVCLTFSTSVTLGYLIFFLMLWFGQAMREVFLPVPVIGPILYYILPHFALFDVRHRLVHVWEPLPAGVMGALGIYALLYSAIAVAMAHRVFKRKWL